MKSIFILGAGASRQAGGPLMSDFLDQAENLMRLNIKGVVESKNSFEDVFKIRSELQSIYAKSYLDLDNIEALFGAIEMAKLIEKLGSRSKEEILQLRESISTLIYKTLEYSIKYPVRNRFVYPPSPYDVFGELLRDVVQKPAGGVKHRFAFLSFNYDLLLEHMLHVYAQNFSYCLDESETNTDSFPYLKLHGSINWGICQECQKIIPYNVSEANFDIKTGIEHVYFNLGSTLNTKKHCKTTLSGPPVIVPPTWNKTFYHDQLSFIWSKAAEELAEAENIFVIGYSMPETDSFFRYLFALGSESPTRLRRFWVFDPDDSGSVENRYKELVGRGIEKRFEFHQVVFSQAIPIIRKALEKP